MEAQVAGAWPISTTRGALAETLLGGHKIPANLSYEQIRGEFVTAIRHLFNGGVMAEDRARLREEATTAFDVEALADDWLLHFETKKLVVA